MENNLKDNSNKPYNNSHLSNQNNSGGMIINKAGSSSFIYPFALE
jgi:hypothetical protein